MNVAGFVKAPSLTCERCVSQDLTLLSTHNLICVGLFASSRPSSICVSMHGPPLGLEQVWYSLLLAVILLGLCFATHLSSVWRCNYKYEPLERWKPNNGDSFRKERSFKFYRYVLITQFMTGTKTFLNASVRPIPWILNRRVHLRSIAYITLLPR